MLQNVNRWAVGSNNSTAATRDYIESFKPTLIIQKSNYLATGGIKLNKDGTTTGLTQTSSASSGAAGLYFGTRRSATAYEGTFNGDIAEVLAYSVDLSDADMMKVASYLAIKFGITLSNVANSLGGNYTASNEGLIWNGSDAPTFQNEIIGIGRDDIQGLSQKQSKTFDDSTRLYIGNLSVSNLNNTKNFMNNLSFILPGVNNRPLYNATNNTEYPTGVFITSRVDRTWKITNTNFLDTFSINMALDPNINITNLDTANLVLIVGNISNLSTGNVRNRTNDGIIFTVDGTRLIISNLNTTIFPINATSYFTIASRNTNTTLPISYFTLKSKWINNTTTSIEINNSAPVGFFKTFYIEKSYNTTNWITIKTIQSINNIITLTDNVEKGVNIFYRIKALTNENNIYYSSIDLLQAQKTKNSLLVFPNPSSNILQIFNIDGKIKDYKIMSSIGQIVTNKLKVLSNNNNSLVLDITNLLKGMYFIQIGNHKMSFIKN